MNQFDAPIIEGNLRRHMVNVPTVIEQVSGIRIFGKLIKSLVFTTDVALIRNCNANAVIAVYPFTPQPIITHALINASEMPIFCGIGGGTTTGNRVIQLAQDAEFQGAMGVVLNAPTENKTIEILRNQIDIPIVVTVVSDKTDIEQRIKSGATILNVSGSRDTIAIIKHIRRIHPTIPIIATGGPTSGSILRTIEAGANAITYTPPTSAEIFRGLMNKYRDAENII